MILRNRRLPPGWYPENAQEIREYWSLWTGGGAPRPRGSALAALAPHAGWAFSGRLAALAVASLAEAETVVVVGGHLPEGHPAIAAPEEGYETPLGALRRDGELHEQLAGLVPLGVDRSGDNTVEVLLPLVACAFPSARVLWLRAPAGEAALALGSALAEAGSSLGRSLVVLASTDLTHYGPDYDFEPAGTGTGAEAWVRETSDPGFIRAALARDGAAILAAGAAGAACSSGAAAAAASFATARGCTRSELLGYATSLDVRKAASFVGYCAIAWG